MSQKSLDHINLHEASILRWITRINKSKLTVREYFKKHKPPFNRNKYYIYKKRKDLIDHGHEEILLKQGGNRKLNNEHKRFLQGCILTNQKIKAKELKEKLDNCFGVNVSLSAISRARREVAPEISCQAGRPQSRIKSIEVNPLGGFELIIAVAYHLGWPQQTQEIISKAVNDLKKSKSFRENVKYLDYKGRTKAGQFTSQYNRRKEVLKNRFKSIADKVGSKNWQAMNIVRDHKESIIRKNVALLSLPVITTNGRVRTINTALGLTMKYFCSVGLKQGTLTKYLSELKYLGISAILLKEIAEFWKTHWREEYAKDKNCPFLCYYIDGNTKAIWSSQRIKQNKVTMLGRVMGCLEQMFINDMYGHPIYFETYSGHGPVGKHVLEMFEKIEDSILEVRGSRTNVCRAIIMDSANNSAETLRSFTKQDEYFYITPLDDNQLTERKIIQKGRSSRYQYGDATLQELVIELEDSKDKKYLITTRVIKIDWDNGKKFSLLNNLPDFINSSEIVYAYFKRWPSQELQFKNWKASVSLSHVVGYGRKLVKNVSVQGKIDKLNDQIINLEKELKFPLEEIEKYELAISKLIVGERKIKVKCKIKNGIRIVPKKYQKLLSTCESGIKHHQAKIKKIQASHGVELKSLQKKQKKWLNLQRKEYTYEIDVELDQIMTFFRVSLANIFAYFIRHFLGERSMSMVMLIEKIIHLKGSIETTGELRRVALEYNKNDKNMMKFLGTAIEKINKLNICGPTGKIYSFAFSRSGI